MIPHRCVPHKALHGLIENGKVHLLADVRTPNRIGMKMQTSAKLLSQIVHALLMTSAAVHPIARHGVGGQLGNVVVGIAADDIGIKANGGMA